MIFYLFVTYSGRLHFYIKTLKMATIEESNLFGTIRLEDIVEFEKVNKVHLPDDYKQFLKDHNGGRPVPNLCKPIRSDVQWIYGMVEEPYWASLFQHLDIFRHRIPSWYFPIANDSGGNLYILSLYKDNHGTIAFWDHELETSGDADQYFENMTFVASSFTEFLDELAEL